jgi:DNA-directed RNA polymerase subunit F
MEIVEEKPITKYEVLEILKDDIEKGNASLLEQMIYENIKTFSKEIDYKKIKEELKNLNLKEKEIVSIIDFFPQDYEDLFVLFGKHVERFEDEIQKKIIELFK